MKSKAAALTLQQTCLSPAQEKTQQKVIALREIPMWEKALFSTPLPA